VLWAASRFVSAFVSESANRIVGMSNTATPAESTIQFDQNAFMAPRENRIATLSAAAPG
jgi:hypothetical protein